MRYPLFGLHPPFVGLVVTSVIPHCVGSQTRLLTAVKDYYICSFAPEVLASVWVMLSGSIIT